METDAPTVKEAFRSAMGPAERAYLLAMVIAQDVCNDAMESAWQTYCHQLAEEKAYRKPTAPAQQEDDDGE